MQVASWMSSPVHTVRPETTVGEAVGLLRRYRIRHLPVMEGDRVVGVVTDRDLRGVTAETRVTAIMSRPVVVVSPRTAMEKAARLLFDRRIGCLPVIEEGKLVGILTQTDAVAALVKMMRVQVGGHVGDVVVVYRPEAMALAHHAVRSLGLDVARLMLASLEPFGRGLRPERVRLAIETRDMDRVIEVLRAAGLTIVAAPHREADELAPANPRDAGQ